MKVVEARGLRKKVGDHKVLDDISLDVVEGECFGILGPKGSGKSTLVRALYGACQLDAGELFVNGLNLRQSGPEVRSSIGVVASNDGLDHEFTVRENIQLFGVYQGLKPEINLQRVEKLLKTMGLEPWAEQDIALLPEGMSRRLALARSLVHNPRLLILDEPSQGMNAKSRHWLWGYLRELREENKSVFITTCFMEEAEMVCDRVAVISKGQILAIGEPHILISELIGSQVVELNVNRSELQYYSTRLNSHQYRFQALKDQINVHLTQNQSHQPILELVKSSRVTMRSPNLSDVYLKLSGHSLREEAQ